MTTFGFARLGVVAACLLVAVPTVYAADDAVVTPAQKAQARDLYRSAIKHYNLSEYSEALVKFKDAYRIFEDPSFLFNIGQCQRQLGQKQEAIKSFRAYVRMAPNATNRDVVEKMVMSLEITVAQELSANRQPPQGMLPPSGTHVTEPTPTEVSAPVDVTPATVVVSAPPTPREQKKHTTLIIIGVVAGVVVVGLAVGLGVGLGMQKSSYPKLDTSEGTFRF